MLRDNGVPARMLPASLPAVRNRARMGTRLALAATLAVPLLSVTVAAQAQSSGSGPGWFVPKSQQAAAGGPPGSVVRRHPSAGPVAGPGPNAMGEPDPQAQGAAQTPPVLPLPPIPALSEIPKGAAPPAAVIGVLSVPDVMRQSVAAQQVERTLGARRDKLNQDAQKEQASWRDLQQQIQNSKLSPEQLASRERALQQRVTAAQRDFRNRNRIIQEAAQVSLGQIERELVQVIRQVAGARGMNLVLHREQVALNINDFDITLQVSNQLNSTLSSVFIPADGVDPEELARSGSFPTTANPGPQPAPPPVSTVATTPVPAGAAHAGTASGAAPGPAVKK